MSYKIGVVGQKESVMAFKLVGFDVAYGENITEARQAIKRMAQSNYGIIYISDTLMLDLSDVVDQYASQLTPALISIPTHRGSNGYGKEKMRAYVEKAVGQNIL